MKYMRMKAKSNRRIIFVGCNFRWEQTLESAHSHSHRIPVTCPDDLRANIQPGLGALYFLLSDEARNEDLLIVCNNGGGSS
jgi:hypothetical protein